MGGLRRYTHTKHTIQSYLENISKIFFYHSFSAVVTSSYPKVPLSEHAVWLNILNATGILWMEGTAFGGFLRQGTHVRD